MPSHLRNLTTQALGGLLVAAGLFVTAPVAGAAAAKPTSDFPVVAPVLIEPQPAVKLGTAAYFIGRSVEHGITLFRTDDADGGGISVVGSLCPGSRTDCLPTQFVTTVVGDQVVIARTTGAAMWATDGDAAPRRILQRQLRGIAKLSSLRAAGARLVVWIGGRGRHQLISAAPSGDGWVGITADGEDWPIGTTAGGSVYFLQREPSGLSALRRWHPDESEPKTLTTVRESDRISVAQSFSVSGEHAFFAGYDDIHGQEPWYTDGTAAGTRMLADVMPGYGFTFLGAGGVLDGHWLVEADPAEGEQRILNATPTGVSFVPSVPNAIGAASFKGIFAGGGGGGGGG